MASERNLVPAGSEEEIRTRGHKVVQVGHGPVLVLHHEGGFHAVDNRCPHMGFPLHQGDVHDGLLDCHWHHARFDVTCGATLDPWADDVDAYRVVVADGQVWVDPERAPRDPREHGLARLSRGLQDRLSLVIGKAVIEHFDANVLPLESIATASRHGALERVDGWHPGLSILSAMANVLPDLAPEDRPRAIVHGCARIAEDTAGRAVRHPLPSLTGCGRGREGLRRWLRETVEVRDADGAERVLATIVRDHGTQAALDAVLAACTDHRFADIGHTLDYTIKCAELCDRIGDDSELVSLLYTSLAPQMVRMQRMEETSAWRRPIDVASLVELAAAELPGIWSDEAAGPVDEDALVEVLLGEGPERTIDALTGSLAGGASPVGLAEVVVTAATRRVLHFGTANELADWDTVHHTLTYASAVAEGMRRAPSPELFRGVLDGAMSVFLDRFLNVPPTPMPEVDGEGDDPATILGELLSTYDGRSPVDGATELAWRFLRAGGPPGELLRTLGTAVLREDSGFHELQQLELAWRRLVRRGDGEPAHLALSATARWIAARYPTPRAREQTFAIARRLQRGEVVHGDG